MEIPKTLFKYFSFDEHGHTIDHLKNSTLYFASPLNFNDPYDCNVGHKVVPFEYSKIKSYFEDVRKNKPFDGRKLYRSFLKFSEKEAITKFTELYKVVISSAQKKVSDTMGVSCFSENKSNLLMWAHYAGKGSGICIEYDTLISDFKGKWAKVHYDTNLPKIDPFLIMNNDSYEGKIESFKLFTVKSIDWNYESEWRLIHQIKGTVYEIPASFLRAIYLGPKISEHHLNIAKEIIKNKYPNTKLYKGKLSKTEFKMDFDSIII